MGTSKASIVVLLALIALTTIATCSLAKQVDPELKQCKHQCLHQQQFTEEQQRQCVERCEDYHQQKQEHAHAGEKTEPSTGGQSKQLKECQKQCERQPGPVQQKKVCSQKCVDKFREKEKEPEPWRRQEEGKGRRNPWQEEEEEWRGHEQEEEGSNPYVFEQDHFRSKVVETEHGRVSFLPKFTRRSKLLRGLENFRFGLLEADPQTFIVPSHVDAEAFMVIAAGRGTITMIKENKRRSINVKQGDIIRVPAGTPVYVTNRDENDRLYIVKLLQPVNSPGEFEIYNGAGGQNPESFYNAFSWELLEAAFQVERSELERLFGQQQQGSIVKASREQIEALSGGGSDSDDEASIWPFGDTKGSKKSKGDTRGSHFKFNLFDKSPSFSNQHGQLFIVDKDDFKQLRDFDLAISFANITKGSMLGPYFNSKSTKISIVLDGEGYIEMACPHLAKQQHQQRQWSPYESPYEGGRRQRRQWSPYESPYEGRQQGQWPHHQGRQGQWPRHQGQEQGQTSFQQVRARLSQGTVFVTPAGHPAAAVASRDSNLQIVCFEVNAENNVKYPLTGKNNIVGLMEKEAQELAFNFPSRDVERIFKSQNEQFFFPGPKRQQERGRRGYADE